MRKYDIKNKRNIGIIIGISIIIIIMFFLVIKFFLSLNKEEYIVSKGISFLIKINHYKHK